MRMTGKESFKTTIHCSTDRWVNLKIICGQKERGVSVGIGGRKTEDEAEKKDVQVWWKTYGKRVDVDDHEVQRHGQGHGRKQPEVAPWGHTNQGLVLRQAWKFGRKTAPVRLIGGRSPC